MANFERCSCCHCGQHIEFPTEGVGITIPCPTCKELVTLAAENPPSRFGSIVVPPASEPRSKKGKAAPPARTNLSNLTEETIRVRTKSGDTPLHRAAKNGQVDKVPSHLLSVDLFMVENGAGKTPLHVAAEHGHLDQVPPRFLTAEALTMNGVYTTGSGYRARTETPLHVAVRCGHVDQIPKEFLRPEFLTIEATGYRQTLLHYLAESGSLDLVRGSYADSEMWSLTDINGSTPRDIVAQKAQSERYTTLRRSESATEKQKAKLRWFGCTWEGETTKGQASDAITECVKRFPELDRDYYNRPASEEQLATLRPYLRANGETPDDYADPGKPLTYGQAKDLISECEMEARAKEEEQFEKQISRIRRQDLD